LNAEVVDILDESADHAGHREGGSGHYRARIVSAAFESKSPLERHRMVYDALRGEIGSSIHALALVTMTPAEARASK